MIKLAANLDWLWKEYPLQARVQSASKAGFHYLESLNPYAQDIQLWRDLLKTHQLELVLINTPPGSSANEKVKGLAAWPSKQTEFRSCFTVALDYARALNTPLVHATAGPVLTGVDWQSQQDSYIQNLQWAC